MGAQFQPPALQRDAQVNRHKVVFGGLGFPAVEQDTDLGVHTTPPFMLKINIQTKAAQEAKILRILLTASQLNLNSGTRKRISFGYPNLLPQKGEKMKNSGGVENKKALKSLI